ncbi:MAG TPA: hypothetical protein VEC08_00585 [Nitrososphaerales archaeon]|nr:hypothetical protein [Nitrososphaerales archaeon]
MVSDESFTDAYRRLGRISSYVVFVVLLAYVPTLILGLLSLKSPLQPIGDPYFSLMELLIVIAAPLMLIVMVAVHAYAPREAKAYSLTALVFMVILTGITTTVHFAILTVSREIASAGFSQSSYLLSFNWPSVAYATDDLAWDLFFAFSMLFAAFVFKNGVLEKAIRYSMFVSGGLSFVGLFGVPLLGQTPVIRNIGVIGYAGVAIVVFLLLGLLFGRSKPTPQG